MRPAPLLQQSGNGDDAALAVGGETVPAATVVVGPPEPYTTAPSSASAPRPTTVGAAARPMRQRVSSTTAPSTAAAARALTAVANQPWAGVAGIDRTVYAASQPTNPSAAPFYPAP